MTAARLIELWRGGMRESNHLGHVVIADANGIVEAWGNPGAVIYPRSSCKMIQALPLVESGAADQAGLGSEHLALACASHSGGRIHTERVAAWLSGLGLDDSDLRCGAHLPADPAERKRLVCSDESPCQVHNNCSGKHAGFLTLKRHMNAGPEYVEIDHPVQRAVRRAFEEVTGEVATGWGIDGCSAPNFACTVEGLAHAMAGFAQPAAGKRGQAQRRRRLEAARDHAVLAKARAAGRAWAACTAAAWIGSKSACLRLRTPWSERVRWVSAATPARARQAFTQCRTQPSRARIGRPERAVRTRPSTPPPTPAMQDISARPSRSSARARWLAICAALEQPEQAYTSGGRGRDIGRLCWGGPRAAVRAGRKGKHEGVRRRIGECRDGGSVRAAGSCAWRAASRWRGGRWDGGAGRTTRAVRDALVGRHPGSSHAGPP